MAIKVSPNVAPPILQVLSRTLEVLVCFWCVPYSCHVCLNTYYGRNTANTHSLYSHSFITCMCKGKTHITWDLLTLRSYPLRLSFTCPKRGHSIVGFTWVRHTAKVAGERWIVWYRSFPHLDIESFAFNLWNAHMSILSILQSSRQ